MGAVPLRIVESESLSQVSTSGKEVPEIDRSRAQRPVRLHKKANVLLALGKLEKCSGAFHGHLELCPEVIYGAQPPQRPEGLRRVSELLTQLPCPAVSAFHLGSCIPLRADQRR